MKRINFLHVLCHFGEGVGVHVASVCVCSAAGMSEFLGL